MSSFPSMSRALPGRRVALLNLRDSDLQRDHRQQGRRIRNILLTRIESPAESKVPCIHRYVSFHRFVLPKIFKSPRQLVARYLRLSLPLRAHYTRRFPIIISRLSKNSKRKKTRRRYRFGEELSAEKSTRDKEYVNRPCLTEFPW